ncbi:hypothetical protein [Paenibacillus sp. FSL K6-1318]|uniref:hypothetical protein n=1 Tax=Paenibacillus sp. FSL K6-1318 TaxID=2975291 RepID=UPI0030EF6886
MLKWLISYLLLGILLSGSILISDLKPLPNTSSHELSEPQLVTYSSKEEITATLMEAGINKFHYIDEKKYEGEELQIVQALNRLMKGVLDFDGDLVRSSYSKEHATQKEDFTHVYGAIVSIDDPRFNLLPDGIIEVFVKQRNVYFSDSPLVADETDKLYFMKKEGSDWRILSVTN